MRLFAAQEMAVLTRVNRGDFTVEGFRNADLQHALFAGQASTVKEKRRRSAAASRWLRLLRAHGLIRKVPGRHRYLPTERGRELITLVLTAQHADVEKLAA